MKANFNIEFIDGTPERVKKYVLSNVIEQIGLGYRMKSKKACIIANMVSLHLYWFNSVGYLKGTVIQFEP